MAANGGALWVDEEFKAEDRSLYRDPEEKPKYAEDYQVVEWKRPGEMHDDPMMIKDGIHSGDVKQGAIGNCWLMGSFLLLGTKPQLLRNLIVEADGINEGFAVFQFFKNGKWQYVIIDTLLPFDPQQKQPLYGHCTDQQEFWVSLMEKAYAKLHGCYEALHGGHLPEGMVDLTGGVSVRYDLTQPEMKAAMDSGQLWKDMKKFNQQGYLIGYSQRMKKEDGEEDEEGHDTQGIIYNHAYGMLRIEDIPPPDSLQMIYTRNPWGSGLGEWNGKFADEDEAWDDHKGLKLRLNYEFS